MSVSTATMGLVELYDFLVANAGYASAAQAMEALNIVIVDEVGAAGTALAVSGGPGELVVGTVGQTALDVAANAQLAATGTGVKTAGIGLLQGETTTGAAALLGMDLGVVAAAAAPILGVSLGAGLYESNPELWTKLSQKLLPFCYPGTTTIPAWADVAASTWTVSVAKSVIEAIRDLFIEENIPVVGQQSDVGTATYDGVSIPIGNNAAHVASTRTYSYVGPPYYRRLSQEERMLYRYVSTSPFTVQRIDSYDGRVTTEYSSSSGKIGGVTYYYCEIDLTPPPGYSLTPYIPQAGVSNSRGDEIMVKGTEDFPSPGEYQPGTSEWEGTTPSTIPESKPAVIGIDSTTGDPITQPMVPISPPEILPFKEPDYFPDIIPQTIPFPWPEPETEPHTRPWPTTMPWPLPDNRPDWWPSEIPYPYTYPNPEPSPDPSVQPDPTEIVDPTAQIQPYILPLPIPWEVTEPNPDPLPQPDPSIPRPPTKIITDTSDPTPPPPEGISPPTIIPPTPAPFAQNVGLVTVYHPTAAQLYSFERWLWVTYADSTIEKIWNNPFDGVISLFELYCTPTDIGSRTIHCGFLDSEISSAVISRYTEIDCGTLGIPEYYGNYLDYSPYTKAHVYLPFIGIQELNPDDIVGHAVNITYRIDEYNGSCIAMITVAKVTEVNGEDVEYSNLMYQFSGNCAVELPLSGGSQASIRAGMMTADAYQQAANISAASQLIGGVASMISPTGTMGGVGLIGSAASSYMYGQAQHTANMLSGKSTVQKSGSFGSSHGALGVKTPFITVTRPKQIQVPNYNEIYGYPAHKMVQIGLCTGYLRCREVHVISPTATDEEKSKIEQLLKSGVYVTE